MGTHPVRRSVSLWEHGEADERSPWVRKPPGSPRVSAPDFHLVFLPQVPQNNTSPILPEFARMLDFEYSVWF